MTSLVTLQVLKRAIDIEDGADDDNLQRALDAATSWITDYTGRTFDVDATDTTRLFYPNADGTVSVPDLVSITSLKTDTTGNRSYATTLAATDYELLPLDGPPYDTIRSWPQSSKSFAAGRQVQIVGKFGNEPGGSVPAAVQQACLILATRFYKRREAPFGILQTVDLGQFTRISKEDPDVISLLAPYKVTGGAWVVV